MTEPIKFEGTIEKVQNIKAGGFRVAIDGASKDIVSGSYLMAVADTPNVFVRVTIEIVNQDKEDEQDKAPGWKTTR